MSLLTDKQKEELQKLADEVLKEAKLVKEDYEKIHLIYQVVWLTFMKIVHF